MKKLESGYIVIPVYLDWDHTAFMPIKLSQAPPKKKTMFSCFSESRWMDFRREVDLGADWKVDGEQRYNGHFRFVTLSLSFLEELGVPPSKVKVQPDIKEKHVCREIGTHLKLSVSVSSL